MITWIVGEIPYTTGERASIIIPKGETMPPVLEPLSGDATFSTSESLEKGLVPYKVSLLTSPLSSWINIDTNVAPRNAIKTWTLYASEKPNGQFSFPITISKSDDAERSNQLITVGGETCVGDCRGWSKLKTLYVLDPNYNPINPINPSNPSKPSKPSKLSKLAIAGIVAGVVLLVILLVLFLKK